MSSSVSSASSVLSIGSRALAQLLVGVALLAVAVLFFAVVLDASFPGVETLWQEVDPRRTRMGVERRGVLATSVLLVLGAYLVGVVVDGVATKLWTAVVRTGDDRDSLREWLVERTDYGEVKTHEEKGLEPWMKAQRWIWSSPRASAEFGDLRLRQILGLDLALVAGLGGLVCLGGLASMGFRVEDGLINWGPWYGEASGRSILLVTVLGSVTAILETVGLVRGLTAPPEKDPNPATGFALLVAALAAGGLAWGVLQEGLAVPEEGWWLVAGLAFSPLAVFAFIHVRLESQRLYHGLIADACEVGPPE